MDLFLTEDDYLPAEFDELPLDEAILRVHELEDDRPSKHRKKGKSKRPRDDEEEDENGSRQGDEYVEEDGWLEDDLGEDGYNDEDEDEDGAGRVEGGVKIFGEDEAEEELETGAKGKKKKETVTGSDEKEKKPKRKVRLGPRVNLNVERLKQPNALAALPSILKKMKFLGKGHEEEDLTNILITMERWAHRIMPRMKFDDFIEKTEQIGRKKLIKTFVAKIRYNLPLDTISSLPGTDFDPRGPNSDDEMLFDDDLPPMEPINAEDAFDALMREAELVVKQRAAAAAAANAVSTDPSITPAPSNSTQTFNRSSISSTPPNVTVSSGALSPLNSSSQLTNSQTIGSQTNKSSLTEEQRRKIAENARKAAEKRMSIAMERSRREAMDQSFSET